MTQIGARIKQARLYLSDKSGRKITQLKLGELCGWRDAQTRISNYENGSRTPSLDDLKAIAQATQTSYVWLLEGDKKLETDATVYENSEFVQIPLYGMYLSAGYKSDLQDTHAMDYLSFQKQWIAEQGLNPVNLMVVFAAGDSMQPRISDGDILLVDTSDTDIRDGKVYALNYEDHVKVKRLTKAYDGSVRIISDNTAYPEEAVPKTNIKDLSIVGRVVWVGGNM